jgi:hypothetical protein
MTDTVEVLTKRLADIKRDVAQATAEAKDKKTTPERREQLALDIEQLTKVQADVTASISEERTRLAKGKKAEKAKSSAQELSKKPDEENRRSFLVIGLGFWKQIQLLMCRDGDCCNGTSGERVEASHPEQDESMDAVAGRE